MLLTNHPSHPGAANASPVAGSYGSNGRAGLQVSQASGDSSAHPGTTAAFQKWIEAPVAPISRNLFTVRIDYFPLDGSRTTQSDATDEGFWTKLEKSINQRTDERQRHDNMIASLRWTQKSFACKAS